jgi:hypothetical protein
VNAGEVRQVHALGYQPTVDQLIQIRNFRLAYSTRHSMIRARLADQLRQHY